jgi:MHS family proline/betaine transporter-like MFS transporter
LPFILGAGIAFMSCCLRRNFKPTSAWLEAKHAAAAAGSAASDGAHDPEGSTAFACHRCRSWLAKLPLVTVLRNTPFAVLRIVAACALGHVGFYSLFVWLPNHLRASGKLPWALELNVGVMLLWAVVVVLGGHLGDRAPATRICQRGGSLDGKPVVSSAAAFCVVVLAPVLFYSLSSPCDSRVHETSSVNSSGDELRTGDSSSAECTPSLHAASIPLLLLCVVAHGLHVGPLQAWFVLSLRAASSRYSALGLAYNVASAVMGGTSPLVATLLASSPLGLVGVGVYLSLAAALAGSVVLLSEICTPLESGESLLVSAVQRAEVQASWEVYPSGGACAVARANGSSVTQRDSRSTACA